MAIKKFIDIYQQFKKIVILNSLLMYPYKKCKHNINSNIFKPLYANILEKLY